MVVRRLLFLSAVAASLVNISACTVLESQELSDEGLIYYLPKTVVTLTITGYGRQTTSETGVEITNKYLRLDQVKTTEIADTTRGYSRSALSTDRVCMGVKPNGLLQTVEAAADDKTGDIIVSVAKLFGRLGGPGAFAGKVAVVEKVPFRTIDVSLDPLDRTQWLMVDRAVAQAFPDVANARGYKFGVEGYDQLIRDATAPDFCPVGSVCYRTKTPVRVSLGDTSSIYVDIVNRRVTGHIDVTRALMVEKITKLGFSDGVLTSVRIRKPSEALAVAKLPLTVVDAVLTSALAAPGAFLGNLSPGLSPADAKALYSDAAVSAEKIAVIQDKLQEIREGDLTTTSGVAAELEVKCVADTPIKGAI
jgi:hypothetical protein